METIKRVCVIVPSFNQLEHIKNFIKSFSRSTYKNYIIAVFDDGSSDGTCEYLQKNYPGIIVLNGNGNYWWSGGNNEMVKYAIENGFDYVLTINNDSTPDKNLLQNLVECANNNPGCIIGSKIINGNTRKIWALGVNVNFIKFPFLELNKFGIDPNKTHRINNPLIVDALTGNGTLVPVEVYKKIGQYDQKWCPQYHGDTEFTYRATKKGIKCLVSLDSCLVNNDFVADPKFSFRNALFSKKSPFYWKPIYRFYTKYAPWYLKYMIFLQFLWIPKRIIKSVISIFIK